MNGYGGVVVVYNRGSLLINFFFLKAVCIYDGGILRRPGALFGGGVMEFP